MTDFKEPITATLVTNEEQAQFWETLFPTEYRHLVEIAISSYLDRLSKVYKGDSWQFFRLSNGGFYMAPALGEELTITVPGNYFQGIVSTDAAGIIVTLFGLNDVATQLFNPDDDEDDRADPFIECYYRLRDFASRHAEKSLIFRAID